MAGAYLGICEHGKARAIFIDRPEYARDIAREIAEWVRDGLTVQHVTEDEGRAAIQERCEPCDLRHHKPKEQEAFQFEAED